MILRGTFHSIAMCLLRGEKNDGILDSGGYYRVLYVNIAKFLVPEMSFRGSYVVIIHGGVNTA